MIYYKQENILKILEKFSSMREMGIPCHSSCKALWKDGDTKVEGVDYELLEAGYYHQKGTMFAMPITTQESDTMIECYFTPKKETTSATICANCGKEKMLHTIGEGIKANKVVIITEASCTKEDELFKELWQKIIEILYDANGTGSGTSDIMEYLKQSFTITRKTTIT